MSANAAGDEDDGFGVELEVESGDGDGTSSQAVTPRVGSMKDLKDDSLAGSNNNNNNNHTIGSDSSNHLIRGGSNAGTANPLRTNSNTGSSPALLSSRGNSQSSSQQANRHGSGSGSGFPRLSSGSSNTHHQNPNAAAAAANASHSLGASGLAGDSASGNIFGHSTKSTGGSNVGSTNNVTFSTSALFEAQHNETHAPGQLLGGTHDSHKTNCSMGDMFMSFSNVPGPGRRSSNTEDNHKLDYDFLESRRLESRAMTGMSMTASSYGGESSSVANDRSGNKLGGKTDSKNKMTKKHLPQPTQNNDELEEELADELEKVAIKKSTSCNLSKLEIKRIPQEIRLFSWLKELLLGDNKIALLPDTIFIQMQCLEVLDLMENQLVTVPRSVFQLKSLKKILLDHNRIYGLPDPIDPDPIEDFGLPQLVECGLEWNCLASFPVNILVYGPKVEKIFLSENPGISQLPPPHVLASRTTKVHIRLDNRPMLLKAAATNNVYSVASGACSLEWNKIYPDRVLEFLYLGSMRTAQCVEVYQDLDIGYVLTAARNLEVVLGTGMKHMTLPFDDLPGEDIYHFLEQSFKFIDEACAAKRGILIHCFAGLSRSVAMTMGYLMKKYRMGTEDALHLIRQSRPSAHPNDGFVARLRDYEKDLKIDLEESLRVRMELEKKKF